MTKTVDTDYLLTCLGDVAIKCIGYQEYSLTKDALIKLKEIYDEYGVKALEARRQLDRIEQFAVNKKDDYLIKMVRDIIYGTN
jgi:hypothetical protein